MITKLFEFVSGYIISYEDIKKKLSNYKSITFTEDKIEFIFDELSKETNGECYYQWNLDKMVNLFENYIISFYKYNSDTEYWKTEPKKEDFIITDQIMTMTYKKLFRKSPIKLGTGTVNIEYYDKNSYKAFNVIIDKTKPFTVYIDETTFIRDADKYNL